jgi:glycosyltransferase involved in cell wall biosynthesis
MAIASAVGRIVGRAMRTPVISTIHTDYKNRTFPAKFIDYTTSSLSDANIPVSSSVEKSLPQSFGFDSSSKIIHNCIDSNYVYQRGTTPWRKNDWTDGIPEDQPLVVTVGRFDPKKRHEDLIRALEAIHQKREDVIVAMTGWGDRREQLEEVAREHDVRDSVFFVGKVDNPYSLFYHSDIISFQSLHEGFSIAMLEAMAFGTPIVATDIPPFREALGESYPLVPTRSPTKLANRTLQLLSDRNMAEQLGRQAQERVNQHFSGSKAAESYSQIYSKVIDRNERF